MDKNKRRKKYRVFIFNGKINFTKICKNSTQYKDFIKRLKVLIKNRPDLIITALSNIFTMRLIGNKTHGDLAEIAIAEFINQYMYDFCSKQVGKDLYRSKSHEEDIKIINEITKEEFPVSLKAYGQGPLQLSTDKNSLIFSLLQKQTSELRKGASITVRNNKGKSPLDIAKKKNNR